ncbi:GNAT family N-acetyltransferase [Acidobacteriia bacterium AH_259_A11_L15]|nr:GNAT family N-acetyltransferase [Acidobacteriia bacterium AH_259_A11_L15]
MREFEASDFEAAYRLDQTCYPPGIAYSRFALREFFRLPGVCAWVAEEEGGLVGFVIVRRIGSDRGHVITLDVRQDRRRQGIGRALLQTAERWLAQQGARRVRLETAVENQAAVTFWQRMGYETLGVLPGYYLDRLDAYRMEKRL